MFCSLLVKRLIIRSTSCAAANKTDPVLFDKSDTSYYSSNMNLPCAAKAVREAGAAVASAIEEDKMNSAQLAQLKEKALNYLISGELCGRAMLKNYIKELVHTVGVHALIIGGRSTGKSLLVSSILSDEKAHPGHPLINIFKIDARADPDMLNAIRKSVLTESLQNVHDVLSVEAPGVSNFFKDGIAPAKTAAEAVAVLANVLEAGVSHNVLMIDTAKKYMPVASVNSPTYYRDFYGSIVLNTKQLSKMAVFQITSTQDFTDRLRDLGCRVDHITHIMVMAEPSPKEALEWLASMGVPENLRSLLVNLCGGHVYDICQFLISLPTAVALGQIHLPKTGAYSVGSAVTSWLNAGGSYEEIRWVLQEVARTGFYPMETNAPMARILTAANVCISLSDDALEFHVPPTLRRGRSGLTP